MAGERAQYGHDERMFDWPTVYRDGLFAGQTALVSGGGSGLGRATAILFARLGARVLATGRNPDKLARLETDCAGRGLAIETAICDIRDPDAVAALIGGVFERHGRLDHLINNAGGQFAQDAIDFSVKGWRAVIDNNLNGSWWMMQAAARCWRDRGGPGSIVNVVADIWRGLPGVAHTAAARAGVIYLSKTVAVEWAGLDVRVNCVAPGCCETTAFARYPAAGAATFRQSNPMLRAGDEWDIAEAIVYLSAPSAKFVTGEVVTVDGGQQLWGDFWAFGRPARFELDYGGARREDER